MHHGFKRFLCAAWFLCHFQHLDGQTPYKEMCLLIQHFKFILIRDKLFDLKQDHLLLLLDFGQ